MPVPPDTARLSFRDWSVDDLDAFHVICSDPRVTQFVADGLPWERKQTAQFISRNIAAATDDGCCQWAVIHKADACLIGYCGFVVTANGPEIGWRLAPEYWGHGLATEAARHVMRFGFGSLGFDRIIATVQSANLASLRITEKLGLRHVTRLQRHGREIQLFQTDRTRAAAE